MIASFHEQVDVLERVWATSQRWSGVERTYTAADVALQQGEFDMEDDGHPPPA